MSPALRAWLRTATKEPNWLTGMSLPLLENKIKNRECARLLNVMQQRGRGSCLRQDVPGRSAGHTRLAGQTMGGMRGEGPGPFNCSVPDGHPKLGENIFKMRSQDHPSLKGPVLFRLDRLPHLLGK